MGRTIGLPRMHKEAGERRDFLPDLVAFLGRCGAGSVVIESGYGSGMGLQARDYLTRSRHCRVGSHAECFEQDVVLVLRYPAECDIARMRAGAILISMIHFPTRPGRIEALAQAGVDAVSLDCVADDRGRRLVENLESVGWNGVRSGFAALARGWPALESPTRPPLRVLILGGGAVGSHAVRAAVAWGDRARRDANAARGIAGAQVTVIDYDLSGNAQYVQGLLERTDLLVDATQRRDVSRPVIENRWLQALPAHAVLVDLSVDPYDFTRTPPQVKGLEGVPEGNLDQYEFAPDDPAYDRIPRGVDTRQRRVALSCYSWPGIDPKPCMDVYGKQIEPLLRVVMHKPLDRLDTEFGPYFERAVARAELKRWRSQHPH